MSWCLLHAEGLKITCRCENYAEAICHFSQAERVHELNEEIGKLLAKAEQLGAEGNVEESQKVMEEVEKARAKKREAEVRMKHVLLVALSFSLTFFLYCVKVYNSPTLNFVPHGKKTSI